MNTLRIIAALFWLLPIVARGQKLESITGFELEYWRSFHGVIKQTIRFPPSGEITLNSDLLPGKNETEQEAKRTHTMKLIAKEDLAPVLALFNDPAARKFFAETKPKLQPDGSALSITVTQNSLSLTFSSQDAFVPNPPPYASALGRAALELFRKAGIVISKNDLY